MRKIFRSKRKGRLWGVFDCLKGDFLPHCYFRNSLYSFAMAKRMEEAFIEGMKYQQEETQRHAEKLMEKFGI